MLEISNLSAAYGAAKILRGVSFSVKAGEIVCLLGRNGAGKTTTLKTIMGLLPITDGTATLDGVDLGALPGHEVPRQGIGYIPQGRRLFGELTVAQNLEIGMLTRKSPPQTLDDVLDIFPRLRERLSQRAQTLSGGEQQMLATARALCLRPKLLLLDEPTEGLQPSMIGAIRDVILKMRDDGVAVLLVEQRVDAVLAVADNVVFIENGVNKVTLPGDDLRANPQILRTYLGV
ncbi:MAG: ABC transporter ATP-binding protein [Rhodobacteraceae bacterium]|nr:ABC transporter ATP-binding protein [Paracoccaceae bacterium]